MSADTDGDGLSDAHEDSLGTNREDRDTDDDGASDGDEFAAGRNPLLSEGAVLMSIFYLLLSD